MASRQKKSVVRKTGHPARIAVEYEAPRLRLVQDDSSHWYAIPADKKAEFELWEKTFGWRNHDFYEGEDFQQYRLNMHPTNYTFTNLKEDK
jgi:hypothetical protein